MHDAASAAALTSGCNISSSAIFRSSTRYSQHNKRMRSNDTSQIDASPIGVLFPIAAESEPHRAVLRLYSNVTEATISTGQVELSGGDTFICEDIITCTTDIPSYYSILDLLNFVCPVDIFVKHYWIIRDQSSTTCTLLMKFRNLEAAREYYWQYSNRPFTSMEPDVCQVLFIDSIEANTGFLAPYSIPFLPTPQYDEDTAPTCPVCLEVMDERISSLLTILCQHTFHYYCLSKWGDGSCPVCRYSQISTARVPSIPSIDQRSSLASDLTRCADCGSPKSLWICLICGHAGCKDDGLNHASIHYKNTSHPYALEIETQRVWDYVGDGYVHRLIQNMVDGKIVELSNSDEDPIPEDKMESLSLEFSSLLTTKLDSQRIYYEDLLDRLTAQLSVYSNQVKSLLKEFHASKCLNENIITRNYEKSERARKAVTQKNTLERQTEQHAIRNETQKLDLTAGKKLTTELLSESQTLRSKLLERKNSAKELCDQIRDLTFFLEARDKVQKQPELKGGDIGTNCHNG